jgi:methylisocitrate lyase
MKLKSLVTLEGFCQVIKDVHLSSGLPVLADADTGFGEGEMCAKTVWEYFNAGAAGLFQIMRQNS